MSSKETHTQPDSRRGEFSISRRRLLGGLGTIGFASVGAQVGTTAFFSDTETVRSGFVAGSLDLKVTWQQRYYGPRDPAFYGSAGRPFVNAFPDHDGDGEQDEVLTRVELADKLYRVEGEMPDEKRVETLFREQFADIPDDVDTPIISLDDVKPGDSGCLEICLHLFDNPGYIWLVGRLLANKENDTPESELSDEQPNRVGVGELARAMRARVYYGTKDANDGNRGTITSGSLYEVLDAMNRHLALDGDRDEADRQCYPGKETQCITLEWELPEAVGNDVQTDSVSFEFGFYAEQCRHNSGEPTVWNFRVHAIDMDIVYNSFGVHQPNGAMYVLEQNLDLVRSIEGEAPTGMHPHSLIEPLTLRVNQGDIVNLTLVNSMHRSKQRVSMHQTVLPYRGMQSDGMVVGYNPDGTVGFTPSSADPTKGAEEITYTWYASYRGTHYFGDGTHHAWDSTPNGGNPEKINGMARGLFGALVVEPRGATWTDPVTGGPLISGVKADIHDPDGFGTHYREFLIYYHDPGEVVDANGDPLRFPNSDTEQHVHGLNYRGEMTGARLRNGRDDAEKGFLFYSSWIHGDPGGADLGEIGNLSFPGDLVMPTYAGDPTKLCVVGANLEENHSHHLHNHRWSEIPGRADSDTIDAQTVGAGVTFETYLTAAHGGGDVDTVRPDMTWSEAFEVGSGYVHRTVGDALMHCHLFPHYAEGMNSILRMEEKQRVDLQVLPNNPPVIPIGSSQLGWPEWIPFGEVTTPGNPVPEPPYNRPLTEAEKVALGVENPEDVLRGAPYANPAPDDAPVRKYTLHAIYPRSEAPGGVRPGIVYNDGGDYDPRGQAYVTPEDLDDVLSGTLAPEPLFIRARVGEVVELTLHNHVNKPISIHPHFVGFDLQGSDSLTNGYNYDQGVDTTMVANRENETLTYRWYADEEGVIFFHDHMAGIEEGMHGAFAFLVVEPADSVWKDPFTGDLLDTDGPNGTKVGGAGAQAIIETPDGDSFREVCLMYHDFAPLIKRNADPTPILEGRPEDQMGWVNNDFQHNKNGGVAAINYRNSPYYHRTTLPNDSSVDVDASLLHSSAMHGDPETPILESYEGEEIRVRFCMGPYEEQHSLQIHGLRADQLGVNDPREATPQVINISEAFSFRVREEGNFRRLPNPEGLPARDYMYGSTVADNLWNGMWGLFRVWGARVDHLHPIEGTVFSDSISEDELRALGHSAPYVDWQQHGQKAWRRYDNGTPDEQYQFPPDKNARRNEFVGRTPPKATEPGMRHHWGDTVRRYDVTALEQRIEFNSYGDHDDHGIVFALDEHVDDIRSGTRHPEPLVIRANKGDVIEIHLTNELPADVTNADHFHPKMRGEGDTTEWKRSNHISLHPQNRLVYDVQGSDGATVGFNYAQTVAPGDTIVYRWKAIRETSGCVMWDMADLRSSRHHGAFGMLIIEPENSTWLDPETGDPLAAGAEAVIVDPAGEDFREFALLMSDGRHIETASGQGSVVEATLPEDDHNGGQHERANQVGDTEDQGYPAVNNRSEPFRYRFDNNDEQYLVYSSNEHGDPNTPVLKAHLGDPVRFRVAMAADKDRGSAFHLSAHPWERFAGIIGSPKVGSDSELIPGSCLLLDPIGNAGGLSRQEGDFIYQEMKQIRRLEAGWWGIFRVRRDFGSEPVFPLPDRTGLL